MIPVIAITIIKIGDTISASTAAWPRINAPTIPTVGPSGEGTLTPASLIISKESSINPISTITTKGTVEREATIENNNSDGINSPWYVVIAI